REPAHEPLQAGTAVMFDFGAVVDGYCSDFGRTIYCGEPPADVREVYEIMLAAQEAGRAASVPGALARKVNAACRAPIEEAGLGEYRSEERRVGKEGRSRGWADHEKKKG